MPAVANRSTSGGKRLLRRYPFWEWERLKPLISWRQGEHVLCVGGTGSGKSTVAGELLPRRDYVVVCVSKGMDPIFSTHYYSDYDRIKEWPPRGDKHRVLLWPDVRDSIKATAEHKQAVFRKMFDRVLLHEGHWCIDIDETHYMCETLRLSHEVTDILEQGRSAKISMWNNTQRPAGIPLATYVNSRHAFLFQSQEDYDLDRLAKMGNKHTFTAEMKANLDALDSFENHEFIYLDRSGRIPPVRSIVSTRRKSSNGRR